MLRPWVKCTALSGSLWGAWPSCAWPSANKAPCRCEVITTSEIEGERLNLDAVRSSIARKLGMDIGALVPKDLHVDGMVVAVLDVTRNFDQALTAERLFGWHAALCYINDLLARGVLRRL